MQQVHIDIAVMSWDSFRGCNAEYPMETLNVGEWRAGSACCII